MSKRLRPRLGLQATVTSACSVRREMENNLKRGRLGMRGVTSAVTHRIHSVAVLYSSKRRHYDRYVAEHSRLSIERRRAGVQACSLRRDATFEGRQRV
jgi:hypothetical protein